LTELSRGREPVLLLHGQPGGARDWDRVIAALGGRAQTIAIDRPGWDERGGGLDLAGNAAAAVAALDDAGVGRTTIVGHSFGAAVAAWLGASRPERVARLVLLAPAANTASLQWIDRWLAAPILGPLLSGVAVGGPGVALALPPVRRSLASRLQVDAAYLQAVGRALRRPSATRTFLVEQRAVVSQLPALEARLPEISAPTTIVIGSADRIVPPFSAKLLAGQIRGAALVPIRGAGHLLAMHHADQIAALALGGGGSQS